MGKTKGKGKGKKMILLVGGLLSIYISYLLIPGELNLLTKSKSVTLKRLSLLLVISYLLYLIFIFINLFNFTYTGASTILLVNGLLKVTGGLLLAEIIGIIMLVLILFVIKDLKSTGYLLILVNMIGVIYLINSNDFVVSLISWELLNYTAYMLTTLNKTSSTLASGIKYFLLSALTTTLLFIGISIIYLYTGTLSYTGLKVYLTYNESNNLFYILLLCLIPIYLKLSVAPFHGWAPDLYSNLPVSIGIYMIIIPKYGVAAFLLFSILYLFPSSTLTFFNLCFASISMIIGSFGLGNSWSIKRFMAYSGIAHIGYIVALSNTNTTEIWFYYIVIYLISTFIIFTILISISELNIRSIYSLNGLWYNNKFLCAAFILVLFSLAGIPPLAGFYGKYYGLTTILNMGYNSVGIIAVLTSIIGACYYISLVKIISFNKTIIRSITVSTTNSYIISTNTVLLLLWVIFSPVISPLF